MNIRASAICNRLAGTPLLAVSATLLAAGTIAAHEAEIEPAPDTLTGGWRPRVTLEERGVLPFATLAGEFWNNVNGGEKTGSAWNTLLDFGFELDTEKLGWWNGGRFMTQFHWARNQYKGVCFADYTGALNPVSGIMAGNHFRIFNLWYQHAWNNGEITLKAGQIVVDDDFMLSDYAALFLNSAFGAIPSQVGATLSRRCGYTPAFPVYPVAAPGILLQTQPAEWLHFQTGIYYGNPGPDSKDNYGFDWTSQAHSSVAVFCEGAVSYSLVGHTATFRLGGTYHSGDYDDFAAINDGHDDAVRQGMTSAYAIHDLVLITSREKEPVLAAFCRGGISPQTDRSVVTWYADAGLNWFGPIPGRDKDIVGAAVSYMHFGEEFRRSTAPNGVAESESVVEVTYRANITQWLAVQADAQWLFNPARNPGSGQRETATVLGLRAEVSF